MKWSCVQPSTLFPGPRSVHSAIGSARFAPPKLSGMNPRYRRMVIPGALVALILVVVVTALLRG